MFLFSTNQLTRRFYPFLLVCLIAILSSMYLSTTRSATPLLQESLLQEKAECVLKGLGERSPVIVVTLTYEHGKKTVSHTLPSARNQTVESRQSSSELLAEGEDKKGYEQTKESVNYALEITETSLVFEQPRLARISCLAEISSTNLDRREEIEQALAVALGMDLERGDQVMVVAQSR